VIGVAVYFLSQPKEGTVEWHKSQYLKTLKRLSQDTWTDKLQRVYRRITRRPSPVPWDSDAFSSDVKAFEHHLNSLVRLGFLQEARVSLTNARALNAKQAGFFGRHADEELRRFIAIGTEGDRIVHIVAPPSDLPRIEAAIRQADVPASK